jgi:hypothetical protein
MFNDVKPNAVRLGETLGAKGVGRDKEVGNDGVGAEVGE